MQLNPLTCSSFSTRDPFAALGGGGPNLLSALKIFESSGRLIKDKHELVGPVGHKGGYDAKRLRIAIEAFLVGGLLRQGGPGGGKALAGREAYSDSNLPRSGASEIRIRGDSPPAETDLDFSLSTDYDAESDQYPSMNSWGTENFDYGFSLFDRMEDDWMSWDD
jgi:hypothetical protein